MDHVPQKRPERDDAQSVASHSIVLPERSRGDESARPAVTTTGGREVLATSGANDPKRAPAHDDEDDDDDYTSSSGSSLSSSDDEDEEKDDDIHGEIARESSLGGDSDQITSLPARKKPNIRRLNNQPSLLSKLSAFLPQMKSANEDLQREIAAGRTKDIQLDAESEDEHREGQYIEMVCLPPFSLNVHC
ncbi:hypothetical protein BJX63DRAFT_77451 [Aspergillus granulosus]|uniref:Uncharacterized protein n=1 Tax=Aspergillus granulosus TaxID=176169 RepID=A0ABR4GW30_9EURO